MGAMDTWCNSQTQEWLPQGTFLSYMGDKDWQTHHEDPKAHTWHHHNLRGGLARTDQKVIRAIRWHFYTSDQAPKWQLIGTTTEASVSQSWPSKVHKEKLGKLIQPKLWQIMAYVLGKMTYSRTIKQHTSNVQQTQVRTMIWLGPGQCESSISHIGLTLINRLKENVLILPPALQNILRGEQILISSRYRINKNKDSAQYLCYKHLAKFWIMDANINLTFATPHHMVSNQNAIKLEKQWQWKASQHKSNLC